MKIIQRRKRIETEHHEVNFWYTDHVGTWGFSFDCDPNGRVLPRTNPDAEEHYQACLTGSVNGLAVLPGELRSWTSHYTQPAIGLCDHCGREVELGGFTNTCDCGADYNSSGQRLADRSQWGEETGESLSDILRIK